MEEPAPELLAACRAGDRDAQRQFYELCHRQVYRIAFRLVGPQEAADVTQQVFLRLLGTVGQFRGRSRFRTWLYRLVVNECLQYLRRGKRFTCAPLAGEPADTTSGDVQRSEMRELLEEALGRLEPDLRAVFLLREVEAMTYAEIAAVLGIPEGTVASRLNRARVRLQSVLVELGWEV